MGFSRKLRKVSDPIGYTLAKKNKNTWWGKRYLHPGKHLRKDLGLNRLFGSTSSATSYQSNSGSIYGSTGSIVGKY